MAYFERKTASPLEADGNYEKEADTPRGQSEGYRAMNSGNSYQLLICNTSFYAGFLFPAIATPSAVTSSVTLIWCGDKSSPCFHTASTNSEYKLVAFTTNDHRPVGTRLISVGCVRCYCMTITTIQH